MDTFPSGNTAIRIAQHHPSDKRKHPAVILLHGAGGNISFWLDRLAPALSPFGVSVFAPHYFEKTGTVRATPEIILDGRHVPAWLAAATDALTFVAAHPAVDSSRIAVLGISLGGFLAVALATRETRLKAVIELSAGMPPGFESGLSPATPPILILHGEQDSIVPVSEAHKLRDLLETHDVPHAIQILPNENHWFSPAGQFKLLASCGAFLSRHL